MNVTLNQLFSRYPVKANGIASRLGRSREWLGALAAGRMLKNKAEKAKALQQIETEIHSLGRELLDVKIMNDET